MLISFSAPGWRMTIHHSDPLERQGKNEAVFSKIRDRRTHGDRDPPAWTRASTESLSIVRM
jgi:hypothetical protein